MVLESGVATPRKSSLVGRGDCWCQPCANNGAAPRSAMANQRLKLFKRTLIAPSRLSADANLRRDRPGPQRLPFGSGLLHPPRQARLLEQQAHHRKLALAERLEQPFAAREAAQVNLAALGDVRLLLGDLDGGIQAS